MQDQQLATSFDRLRDLLSRFDEIQATARPLPLLTEPLSAAFNCLDDFCTALYPGDHYSQDNDWDRPSETWTSPARLNATTLVPITGQGRLDFATRLLEMTALYSQLAIFVIPTTISAGYISYSAVNHLQLDDVQSVLSVLEYNKRYETLVTAGRCIFLPSASKNWGSEVSTYKFSSTHRAPLLQHPAHLQHMPLNAAGMQAGHALTEDLLIYEQIALPYFLGADLKAIADIAEKETDAFIKFNRFLTLKLAELSQVSSSQMVPDILQEINYGIADLRIEAEKVSKSRLLGAVEVGTFVVSLGAVLFSEDPVVSQVAGIVGAVDLLQLIHDGIAYKKERLDLKKSDFYLPYLLERKSKRS